MEEFSSDELNPPSWMDDQFFEEVLKKCERTDKISIENVEISPATAKGDHFASIMFRAVVIFNSIQSKTQSKSMIIKIMPQEEGCKQDFLKESFAFETEIGMYSKTIPKLEEELRKVGDNTVLAAKALYWSLEPQKILILEDICLKGYKVLKDRMATMEESKIAFLKLAKWHAVSYKLSYEGDKNVTSYSENIFSKKDADTTPFMLTGIEYLIEKLQTIDEFKKFIPHLKNVEKDNLQKSIASAKSYRNESPKGIFVLNHGDFHVKNIMTKRNENGRLEDVMLLDFQMSSYAPAILDYMYGIYMLCNPSICINNFDEVMYFYCSNFIDTLKQLKFEGEIPKISDFYIELYRHRHFALFLISSFMPLWYSILEKHVENMDVLLGSDEERKKMYGNSNYLRDLKPILQSMFYRGYLE